MRPIVFENPLSPVNDTREIVGKPRLPCASDPERIRRSATKRGLDIVLASLALIVLMPLLLAVAVAIRLESRGAPLYRQRRNGQGGTFWILKFRTMYATHASEAFRQARRDDDRVTRVGRFLRRSNLDELPQLANVILGDMSLVGPRPHPLSLDEQFLAQIPDLMGRYAVRPGLTGLAQVNGCRGETRDAAQMMARLSHDLNYINTWSLWLDLSLMARTLWHPKAFQNAY